jgi:hypothetical protein
MLLSANRASNMPRTRRSFRFIVLLSLMRSMLCYCLFVPSYKMWLKHTAMLLATIADIAHKEAERIVRIV